MQGNAATSPRPRGDAGRRFALSLALVALPVAALGGSSLALLHSVQAARGAAEESARWTARGGSAALLVAAAAQVAAPRPAPGDARAHAIEAARRRSALSRLEEEIDRARAELHADAPNSQAGSVRAALDHAGEAARSMRSTAGPSGGAEDATSSATPAGAARRATSQRAALLAAVAAVAGNTADAQRAAALEQESASRAAQRSALVAAGAAGLALAELAVWLGARALRRRRERGAAAAERCARERFAGDLTYAIRTPMNAILGLTEIVLDSKLGREQRAALETVRESADALLFALAQVLDEVKRSVGTLTLDATPFELRRALEDVVQAQAPRARRKGIELVAHVAPELPPSARGDRKRLQQVVQALLDNALNHTHQGEVVLRAHPTPSGDGEVALVVEVADTGVGLSLDGPGPHRADDAARAVLGHGRRTGLGLGLRLAAELARRMGGELLLESRPGVGTTARLAVRLGADPHAVLPTPPAPDELCGAPVLVVDDNETCRQILVGLLHGSRAKPAAAASTVEAIALLRQATEDERPFAAAVIDLEMPGLDGLELARQIRVDPRLAALPVVAVATALEPAVAEQCAGLGIAAVVSKPIRQAEVAAALGAALAAAREHGAAHGSDASAAPEPGAAAAPRPRALRVLVADDNRVDRTLAVRLLEKRGHSVLAVEGGEQATAACEHERFDVAFMDVQMPGMNGLAAAAAIRARERVVGGHLPIIALTAGDNQARCLEAGMDAHVTKPVHPNDLAEALARAVPAEHGGAAGAPAAHPLDEEAALDQAGGDRALLVDLAEMCLDDGPAALEKLRDALALADARSVQRTAHRLKGSLLVLAAERASRAAQQLEALGAAGSLDKAHAALATLERELERLRPALLELVDSPPRTPPG